MGFETGTGCGLVGLGDSTPRKRKRKGGLRMQKGGISGNAFVTIPQPDGDGLPTSLPAHMHMRKSRAFHPGHGHGGGGHGAHGSGGHGGMHHAQGGHGGGGGGGHCQCPPHGGGGLAPWQGPPSPHVLGPLPAAHPHHVPKLPSHDTTLPHPHRHPPGFWFWQPHQKHPQGGVWFHIKPAHPRAHTTAPKIHPHALPAHWPPMHIVHPQHAPPREPPAHIKHLPHVVPAHPDPSKQAQDAASRLLRMGGYLAPNQHIKWIPGRWKWSGKAWYYEEPHSNIIGAPPNSWRHYVATHAPVAAFGPRPRHIAGSEFWPNQVGHMLNAYGQHPHGASTTIIIPAHVHHGRQRGGMLDKAALGATMQRIGGGVGGGFH
jgi:hypothetical protein